MAWLEEANTTRGTPAWRAASKTLYVPIRFDSSTACHGESTALVAARWTMASMPAHAATRASRSPISATISTLGPASRARPTGSKRLPGARQAFITNPPIRPLAPVTSTRGRDWLPVSLGPLRGPSATVELIVRPFLEEDRYVARAGLRDRWRVELT